MNRAEKEKKNKKKWKLKKEVNLGRCRHSHRWWSSPSLTIRQPHSSPQFFFFFFPLFFRRKEQKVFLLRLLSAFFNAWHLHTRNERATCPPRRKEFRMPKWERVKEGRKQVVGKQQLEKERNFFNQLWRWIALVLDTRTHTHPHTHTHTHAFSMAENDDDGLSLQVSRGLNARWAARMVLVPLGHS